MKFREERIASKEGKQNYIDGIERLIAKKQRDAEAIRDAYAQEIMNEPERYRRDLCSLLGWPLTEERDTTPPEVKMEKLGEEPTHEIFRAQVEILEGLSMSGLFFKAKSDGKKPLVIVQHGGLGTPELIAGLYGTTGNYNDMLKRVIQHGVHAFAPQLLLWANEYEVAHDRTAIDARLKHLGGSVTALEVYGITRILDYFEGQPFVSTLGMVGMSYGGFFTLLASAIDPRIQAALSCAYFNSRDRYVFPDWTWQGAAEKFDDAEVACLTYPRKLYIRVAESDPLFDPSFARHSFETIRRRSEKVGTDWVNFAVFEGVHEFVKDDDVIACLMKDLGI